MKIKRDHTRLICNVGELGGLFSDATSLEVFLQHTVAMVVDHMQADVCSIYLYDEDRQELVLKATRGLKAEAVGKVRLKLGEGLTGRAVKELRPICEQNASRHPDYKYFPEIGEEPYESFLAVPILRGQTRIGAMVLQNAEKNFFSLEDVRAFQAVTSQLAMTLETARLLMGLKDKTRRQAPEFAAETLKFVKARVGVEGYAYAEVEIFDREQEDLPEADQAEEHYSLEDFYLAKQQTEKQLEEMQQDIEERLSDIASLIFTAQLLMLKDPEFVEDVVRQIRAGASAPAAIVLTVKKFVAMFEALPNDYLREKKHDVRDIGRRLLDNLRGGATFVRQSPGRVMICRQILPSDILKFASLKVCGIILLSGGVTSHIAILARSLEIPLVISDEPALLALAPGTRVLLDAEQGNIYVNPADDVVSAFRQRETALRKTAEVGRDIRPETRTADGVPVRLLANINLLSDLRVARAMKAEGVGLYRTEFPFIIRSDFPSEEEQFVVYRKLVEEMAGRAVTFRTLDIGGDKVLSYYQNGREENPFLGMRSIRFSLRHREVFRQQLRAILRAGHDADLKIMFPMISSVDEFLEARGEVLRCAAELREEKILCHPSPAIGMMLELPAVLDIMEGLADVADFFSIGTNDFIQYMLAVDRTNEKVSDLYLPHHPSILRAFQRMVAAVTSRGKDIAVCGQMAQDERFIPFFVGIGIRALSLDPHEMSKVQRAICALTVPAAEQRAGALLAKTTLKDIAALLSGEAF